MRTLLRRTRTVSLDAFAHQDLPFEQLVEELGVARQLDRQPVFDTMLVLQTAPGGDDSAERMRMRAIEIDKGTSQYDLTWYFTEVPGGLACTLEYSRDLFDATSIRAMIADLRRLLDEATRTPELPISRLPLAGRLDRHRVVEWNGMRDPARPRPLTELFEAQAAKTPDDLAVADATTRLAYRELDRRATRVAGALRELGVSGNTLVGVCLARTADLVVAILGVLKAGAGFVPLDPSYPRPRIELMTEDAGVCFLVVDGETRALCDGLGTAVELQAVSDREARDRAPLPAVSPDAIAYVMYTSGSTGRPHGAAITHANAHSLVEWAVKSLGPRSLHRMLFSTSVCFDLAAFEIFTPLACGGAVMIVGNVLELPSSELGAEASFIDTVPSAMAELVRSWELPPRAETIGLAGEPLGAELVARCLRQPGVRRVLNLYGPVEATTYATWATTRAEEALIGRPVTYARCYVVDEALALGPLTARGELVIGGHGVSRGYLDRPARTARRFVPDPVAGAAGARAYRTGDLASHRRDGQLAFQGRVDRQVKIRGFRIEPEAIERALEADPAVDEAAVLVAPGPGGPELTAFVVPRLTGADGPDHAPDHAPDDAHDAHLRSWAAVWEAAYDEAPPADPSFDTTGWVSSYDERPLPDAEMREYRADAVERIRAFAPRRVLEIGCGTGLVLVELLPHVESYDATDVSSAVLRRLERHLERQGDRGKLRLHHCPAGDLERFEPRSFDAVVLSSVVQYFPTAEYAVTVLGRLAALVRPGGHIFLGDVRSLGHLTMFHADVVRRRASTSALGEVELHRRIDERLAHDGELSIDPRLFVALCAASAAFTAATIELKRGRIANELTRFRYDVTLEIGGPRRTTSVAWQRWGKDTLETLRAQLASGPERLAIAGIPNQRLVPVHDGPPASGAVDPESLWQLAEELGYRLELRFAVEPTCMDAYLQRRTAPPASVRFPGDPAQRRPWNALGNNPQRLARARDVGRAVGKQVAARLAEQHPSHLVVQRFVWLDGLPRTPNGKVDRFALARAVIGPEARRERFVPPATDRERAVARIWSELLDIDRVGRSDSFFDLGGHSLLVARMLFRLNETLGVLLPVRAAFEHPTLAELARALDRLASGEAPIASADAMDHVRRHAILDPSIRPAGARRPIRADRVLLTGATGFIGAHVLAELLATTRLDVVCLVRAAGGAPAERRLAERLRALGLGAQIGDPRIQVVEGDLAAPRLGLSADRFRALAGEIDAIYHVGADVNFLYPFSALRAANVSGTEEVLRLACTGAAKPLHYISTIGIFEGFGPGRYQEADELEDGAISPSGYIQTKWCSERLVREAGRRHLPVAIYRLGTVTGHSRSGIGNPGDLVARLIIACAQTGLASDVDVSIDLTPVDYVASCIVALSRSAGFAGKSFHIVNAERLSWRELVNHLIDRGYPLRVVPYDQWVAWLGSGHGPAPNALAPLMPLFGERADTGAGAAAGGMEFDTRNVDAALEGTSISCPHIEAGLLDRYLSYFIGAGHLPPPVSPTPATAGIGSECS